MKKFVFYINLPESTERRENMIQRVLPRFECGNFEKTVRIEAIDCDNKEMSCFYSHIQTIRVFDTLSENDDDIALILEDDASDEFIDLFISNNNSTFEDVFNNIIENAPKDWQILQLHYLPGNHFKTYDHMQEYEVNNSKNHYHSTVAYVIKRSVSKTIKEQTHYPIVPFDHFIYNEFKTYVHKYPLFTDMDYDSLIQKDVSTFRHWHNVVRKNQRELIEKHITNKENTSLELIKGHGNYKFTRDWFNHNIPMLINILQPFIGQPHLRFLEIGCFEGRSLTWMMDHILTHPTSTMTAIDTFEGSVENTEEECRYIYKHYQHNVSKFENRVRTIKGRSEDVLRTINDKYHVIYIDGDHKASSVLTDAVLSWPLLEINGLMIFDDYLWTNLPNIIDRPMMGIHAFLSLWSDRLRVLVSGYQVIIQKTQ